MEETLLEKLGGEAGISKIVEEFYKRAVEDPRIKNRYNDVNLEELKRKEAAFLIALIKKETPYVEGTLIPAHQNLGITKHEVSLVISIYEDVAKEEGAMSHTAQQFGELIGSVRKDIEGH
jgi:hemoglobin